MTNPTPEALAAEIRRLARKQDGVSPLGDDLEAAIRQLAALATPAGRGAPAEGVVPDEARERELFEVEIAKDRGDLSTFGFGKNKHYRNSYVDHEWLGWLNRARLVAPTSQAGRDALDAARFTGDATLAPLTQGDGHRHNQPE